MAAETLMFSPFSSFYTATFILGFLYGLLLEKGRNDICPLHHNSFHEDGPYDTIEEPWLSAQLPFPSNVSKGIKSSFHKVDDGQMVIG